MTVHELKGKFNYCMHGLGAFAGVRQTNTKEAFLRWYKKGVKVFEFDIGKTTDNKYVAVAHTVDEKSMRRMEVFEKPNVYAGVAGIGVLLIMLFMIILYRMAGVMASIAMAYGHVYVAQVSMGADKNQLLKAIREAEEYNGPSLIIAYSPCISQGILGGLSNQLEEQKILVDVGYNMLMRYNPEEDKLTIDSKEPDFGNYDVVFERELRYRNLENINEEEYEELYQANMTTSRDRYAYFKNIEDKCIKE